MSLNNIIDKIDVKSAIPAPVILGVSSYALTTDERFFLKDANPLGVILFSRNCKNPMQVRALVQEIRDCLGRSAPILMDQEGGTVQRMKEPIWKQYTPARIFGDRFSGNFTKGTKELQKQCHEIAGDLNSAGVNVNCAPVMDVAVHNTHEFLRPRIFSRNAQIVAALGSASCRAYLEKGIIPVVKHLPGHGRTDQDSHLNMPIVDASLEELEALDFLPYHELNTKPFSEGVWGMVSHVSYSAIDPVPASCSRKIIWDIIRDKMQFTNLLLSDALEMDALAHFGDLPYRAEKCLRAGCDVALPCDGKLENNIAIMKRVPAMQDDSVKRFNQSVAWVNRNMRRKAAV